MQIKDSLGKELKIDNRIINAFTAMTSNQRVFFLHAVPLLGHFFHLTIHPPEFLDIPFKRKNSIKSWKRHFLCVIYGGTDGAELLSALDTV